MTKPVSKSNLLVAFQDKYLDQIKKDYPQFRAGDTVEVGVKITEASGNIRIQKFIGLVIAIKNRGAGSSFIVRKESHGVGVERNFLYYSPIIDSIKVTKRGKVRRAKLYYMRNRTGKAARLKEIRNKNENQN